MLIFCFKVDALPEVGDFAESEKAEKSLSQVEDVDIEAEPEPMGDVLVLVETNQDEQKETVEKKDLPTVVDPIVKMLVEVEENDDDIQKEQISDATVD